MKSMSKEPSALSMAYPQLTPGIYHKLHAEVNAACDEMAAMNIQSPQAELLGQMTNRVYGNVKKAYPDLEKYARAYDKALPQGLAELKSLYGVEAIGGGGFASLIAFLLLVGFFGRRGFRRGRRF